MVKKIFSIVLAAALAAAAVSCGTLPIGGGAATTGYGFAQAIASGDYKAAYGYLYENSTDLGTEEEFAQRYTNIFDAMQVKKIELADRKIEEKGDSFTLKYTLNIQSGLMGSLSYNYEADIIPCEKECCQHISNFCFRKCGISI